MKALISLTFIVLVLFLFTGGISCNSPDYREILKPNLLQTSSSTPSRQNTDVLLELTFPAGKSPRVFTSGWVFGAKCLLHPGTAQEKDVSNQVRWTGDAVFKPSTGNVSRPEFKKEGVNTLFLEVQVGQETVRKQYTISTVSPLNYAHVGDKAYCPSDVHGCPACPHSVVGPITTGSSTVTVENVPAVRVGDVGVHAACCGPNTFEIISGDPDVLIDGRPAARKGDTTKHCGGYGKIEGKLISTSTATASPATTTTPSPTTSLPVTTQPRPVVDRIEGSVTIADYGQQLVTIHVIGGKQPYYYELKGNEWTHNESRGGNGIQVMLTKKQFHFDGQIYKIMISVKDSNGQYAAWTDNNGSLKTEFTLGYKYDPGEKNAAGKYIRQPSWVCFTVPVFP